MLEKSPRKGREKKYPVKEYTPFFFLISSKE
jgi:hypothetical protein